MQTTVQKYNTVQMLVRECCMDR